METKGSVMNEEEKKEKKRCEAVTNRDRPSRC